MATSEKLSVVKRFKGIDEGGRWYDCICIPMLDREGNGSVSLEYPMEGGEVNCGGTGGVFGHYTVEDAAPEEVKAWRHARGILSSGRARCCSDEKAKRLKWVEVGLMLGKTFIGSGVH